MKRIISIALTAALVLLVSSCGERVGYRENVFLSMDTVISVKIDPETPDIENVLGGCRDLTESIRRLFDADDPGSCLSGYNNGGEAEPELAALLDVCATVSAASGGAFNPAVRRDIECWREAEKTGVLPVMRQEDRPVYLSDMRGVDLGGIAKGYAAEKVVSYLKEKGARYGILSFGGNIAVFGDKPDGGGYRIAIRDPDNPDGTVGTVRLSEGFVSVSGDYERYYVVEGEKYHHIIDPGTGYPAGSGLRSVAVITDAYEGSGALADALSTALFVMGYGEGMRLYESGTFSFEAVFVFEGEILSTPGLDGRFEKG